MDSLVPLKRGQQLDAVTKTREWTLLIGFNSSPKIHLTSLHPCRRQQRSNDDQSALSFQTVSVWDLSTTQHD